MLLRNRRLLAMCGRSLLCLSLLFWWSGTCWASWTTRYDAPIKTAVDKWWIDLPAWQLWKSQLIAESALNPGARSAVGAEGLAQFMPGTWADTIRALKWPQTVSRSDAAFAIEGGAYYVRKLRGQWKNREPLESHWLAAASYNRGAGNIIKDQAECNGARLWKDISPCTARHTMETVDYVKRINAYWRQMGAQ